MVDTIKFSQMTSGGDLANNETTPGLKSGGNVLFNNPWTFLAPGTTAQRPAPSVTINYRLRLNTDTQLYEYYDAVLGAWVELEANATTPGPFVTYTADATLPDAQNLGLLSNGLLKQTITTGIATLDIAVNGTDYYGPGFIVRPADGGTGINNGALTINLGTPTLGFVLTSDVSGNATWQSVSASGGITTIDGNSGAATPLVGVVTISGASTGLTFTGSSHTLSLGGVLALASGGTNANLTAALGAVPYSTATAIALLAPGTTGQLFQSGGAGAPTWTTTTYPATNAINTIMYASSANILGVITPVNSAVLISSAGGVPSMSTVLPGGLTTTDPTLTQGIATKNYVDQTALNGTNVYAASAATLGTVTQSGAGVGATLTNAGVQATFALDGVNPTVGSSVLIKDTATGMTSANEGIYTVTSVGSGATNWVLTRSTSYDTATEINLTGLIVVQNGSTLAGTAWYNSSTIVTVDTTAFSYTEFGNIVFPITLAHGGTSAALTASNGGIFYSTATAGAILAGTSTAGQLLTSGASTTPAWTTTTYPLTNAINTILYASSANIMAPITPVNSAVMISSSGGVPSWSTTLPSAISASGMILTSPKVITSILDTNGNVILGISPVGSAVNYIAISNSAAGSALSFSAAGSDTDIILSIAGKGAGGAQRQGLMTGGNYSAGFAGEVITSNIPFGSGVSLANNTNKDVTTISVTAGVWDIYGNVFCQSSITLTALQAWVSLTSATYTDLSTIVAVSGLTSTSYSGLSVPFLRVSVAATTTVYLSCLASFASGTSVGCGTLTAIRR